MSSILNHLKNLHITPYLPSLSNHTAPNASKTKARAFRQEASRAGIFITEELEKAISRCNAKVYEIATECRSKNRKFRDIEFDLENDGDRCLYPLSAPFPRQNSPADVLRVSEIFENPQFVVDGMKSSDIAQGVLNDCWFLSGIATMSSKPELIEKICVARDEQVGIYGFIFCRDGSWTDVIIDDQLFTSVSRFESANPQVRDLYHNDKDLYDKVARKGGATLYFARSTQENETWVPLMEKAYAKFHGDYASLEGGSSQEALEDLTGGVSHTIRPHDIIDKDRFWNEALSHAAQDWLFGCSFETDGDSEPENAKGLLSPHCYSIILTAEYKGKRFLKIRDPWAQSEWTGRWSDGSRQWTKEWLGALEILHHDFGHDGEFIMEYEDFLNTWTTIECTQLFDSTWIQSSHWLNTVARPYPSAWQFGDVSYTFTLPTASPTILVLSQADTRFWGELSGPYEWSLEFLLYKRGSKKVLGRSEYSELFTRSVTLSTMLEAGDYVLHVRLDREELESTETEKKRKKARVEAEKARSMSMAANFDADVWRSKMVIPPEAFGGQDLLTIELTDFEHATQERQRLRERYSLSPGESLSQSGNEAIDGAGTCNDLPGDDDATLTEEPLNVTNAPPAVEAGATIDNLGEQTGTLDAGIHPDISCDVCNIPSIHGVRWKCIVCKSHDLCDSCHARRVYKFPHIQGHPEIPIQPPQQELESHVEREVLPDPKEPVIHDVSCLGCKKDQIVGARWKCLECSDYDLCDACHSSGAHPPEHKMVKFETPEDAEGLFDEEKSNMTDETVLIGLRVYTKSEAPVTISGQLRHGKMMSLKNS